MSNEHEDISRHILAVLGACSRCRAHFTDESLRFVGRSDNLWILAVSCTSCGNEEYVAAVVSDEVVDAVEFSPTGQQQEENRPHPEPITVDDVLDMHEFLESFNGDLRSLLSRRHH